MKGNNDAPFAGEAKVAFLYNKDLAERAVAQLSDDQLHASLHPETNSVAVIMKHVAGNLLSRFTDFLTTDGEKPWRDRDDEFVDRFSSRQELMEYWQNGWDALSQTLDSLRPADLQATVTIRGEALSVYLAIARSLSHCGYHVGQIVLISRILVGDDWTTLTIPRGASQQPTRRTGAASSTAVSFRFALGRLGQVEHRVDNSAIRLTATRHHDVEHTWLPSRSMSEALMAKQPAVARRAKLTKKLPAV